MSPFGRALLHDRDMALRVKPAIRIDVEREDGLLFVVGSLQVTTQLFCDGSLMSGRHR